MTGLLSNITVVLVQPKYAENIGAAARISLNMGIRRLLVVGDALPDQHKIRACATHNAAAIIDNIEYINDLETALQDFPLVVGTTARLGRSRRATAPPHDLIDHLAPVIRENRAAVLFGPENRGLSNDELRYCSLLTTIPTADFSSLNLAQAVAIICYELYAGAIRLEASSREILFAPRLASFAEQQTMHRQLGAMLTAVDQAAGKTRPGKRLDKLRLFLNRRHPQAKETRLVSEICRQIMQALSAR